MDNQPKTEGSPLPVIAGILCIIAAVPRLAGSIFIFVLGWLGDGFFGFLWYGVPGMPNAQFPLITLAAVLILIVGLLALIGGICAARQKYWALAVTGAALTAIISWPIGIPALTLTVISRKNFKQ